MVEGLLALGTAAVSKALFEQVLKLGQAAGQDYVKDFFKGCLKEGITAVQPEVAKKAVASAVKAFLLIVADELEDQDLSGAEIRDRYEPALIQFVQDGTVKPLLGKAFKKTLRRSIRRRWPIAGNGLVCGVSPCRSCPLSLIGRTLAAST